METAVNPGSDPPAHPSPPPKRPSVNGRHAAVAIVAAALVTLAFLPGRADHGARIDQANLDLAAAVAAHEEAAARWHASSAIAAELREAQHEARDLPLEDRYATATRVDRQREQRQNELGVRHGQTILIAAQADLHARRLYGSTERFSQLELAVEQVRALARPPDTHPEPPLQWPVEGPVVSGYGLRAWPDFGRMHPGIDIINLPGSPIHAAADGVVVAVRRDRHQGNSVVIDHGDQEAHPGRWTTVYGHLDEITVVEREAVRAGDEVGTLGNTGHQTTGPHLHFEVRIEDQPVDPRRWLP